MQNLPAVIAIALAALGVGFFIGWSAKPAPPTDADAMVENITVIDMPEEGLGLDSPRAREGRLVSELADARAEVETLRAERDALAEAVGASEGADGDEPAKPEKARFVYSEMGEALADVNWKSAGASLAKMPPLIDKLLTSIEKGEPEWSYQAEIQKLNGPLLTEAVKLTGKEELKGTGVNGLFTHPAFQVNLVYSALTEAGLPLDENQTTRLEAIGHDFIAEDAARLAGYGDGTFKLEKIIGEAGVRDRFFAAVDALLTPEQREALHPEISRGRLKTDLYSSGLVWLQLTGPLEYRTAQDLATSLANNAMLRLNLPVESKDIVDRLAVDYAAGYSPAFMAYEPDALDRLTMYRVDRVTVAAQRMLAFLKTLAAEVPLTDDKVKAVRDAAGVLLPLKAAGP